MEYIETTIRKIAKYNEYLDEWARDILEDNLENEELLKMFRRYKRTLEIIAHHFYPNTPHKDYLESVLNEIYTSMRKINYTLTDYEKASVFSKDKTLKDVKKCLERTNFLVEDFLDTMKTFDNSHRDSIPIDFSPPRVTKNKTTFLLSIKNQKNLPLSCENIFVNMVQYKDMVYYVETNDVFSFFYFYRTEDCWFWSPPKKTDPEDIWIECPETRIEEGFWTGKIIPPYMTEFIVWLDLFFPNIPEFYLKKEEPEEKKEEVKEEESKKKCLIF